MTYTTPEDISNLTTEEASSTFDKAKVLYQEGLTRSARIGRILKAAFSQSAAEFREGRQVLSPLAQEVTSETVATVKEKGQKAADALNDAWVQEADSQDFSERLTRFLSAIARSASASAKTQLWPQLKIQASRLDGLLQSRYGDRYTDIREKFAVTRSGQSASKTTPDCADTTSTDGGIVIEVDSETLS